MDELRSVIVGGRRVCLVSVGDERYSVTIEVRGPAGWEDISLRADQNLVLVSAHQRDSAFTNTWYEKYRCGSTWGWRARLIWPGSYCWRRTKSSTKVSSASTSEACPFFQRRVLAAKIANQPGGTSIGAGQGATTKSNSEAR